MPGHYSTGCRERPCPASSATETAAARLFVCLRCRAQVLVCSHCDRGQIYCGGTCAQEARQHARQAAGKRYQATYRGRLNHAARAGRYRARRKIVTHQGSPPQPRNDVVPLAAVALDAVRLDAAGAASKSAAASSSDVVTQSQAATAGYWHCHWCGDRCSPLVRIEFLRGRQRGSRRDRKPRRPP
jgi:hypothetical protein